MAIFQKKKFLVFPLIGTKASEKEKKMSRHISLFIILPFFFLLTDAVFPFAGLRFLLHLRYSVSIYL